MRPLNWVPKPEAAAALPKSVAAVTKWRSLFRHFALLFLNQIWNVKILLIRTSYSNFIHFVQVSKLDDLIEAYSYCLMC